MNLSTIKEIQPRFTQIDWATSTIFLSIFFLLAFSLISCGSRSQNLNTKLDINGHRVFYEHQTDVRGIQIQALTFSPDGRYLASLDNSGVLVLRDLRMNRYRRWQAHGGEGLALAFSPDSKQIASSGRGDQNGANSITIWRAQNGASLQKITTETIYNSIRFQSINRLLSCGWLTGVDEWNTDNGRLLRSWKLPGSDGNLRDLIVGSDNSICASGESHLWFWESDPNIPPLAVKRINASDHRFAHIKEGAPFIVCPCSRGFSILCQSAAEPNGWRTQAVFQTGNIGGLDSPLAPPLTISEDLNWVLGREDMGPWILWADLQPTPIQITTHSMRQTAVALDPPHKRFAYGNGEPFVYMVELP